MKSALNHTYRLIWNESLNAFVAVAENVSAKGKKSSRALKLLAATLFSVAGSAYALEPNALPTGAQITSGQASISQTANQLTINQTSDKLITNWNSFNIGEQASVHFQQPNALSTALNRIAAGNPSQILGNLSANGRVYLINPNGIVFGKNAQVNVGALVASSLNLSDEDFLAEKYTFSNLNNAAAIQNLGNLNGKVVALIAPQVKNDGSITADQGAVALAAGDKVNLDFTGDGLIQVQVNQSTLNGLAENNGLIKADGGLVVMSAQSANAVYDAVVNNTGIIQAHSLENKNGKIILNGPENGIVQVTGTLDTSGKNAGGEIYVGGGWQGKDENISQATRTYISKEAVLNASATDNGNGGTIAVWSDIHNENSVTQAYGNLSATGGVDGGDGGRIETSGSYLDVSDIKINASAVQGKSGLWLLDPRNVTIVSDGTGASGTAFPNSAPYTFTPTADSNILASAIADALGGGNNVTITTGTTGGSRGDVTVSSAITKSTGNTDVTLTLQAANSIGIDAAISNTGGTGKLNLVFDADNDNGTVDGAGVVLLNADIATNGGSFTTDSVYVAGAGARTLSTSGGAINFSGQLIIANTSGFTVSSGGGNVTFTGAVDSGNSYTLVGDAARTWADALIHAKSGNGDAVGDTYLATITSALENAVASREAGYFTAWLGAQRVINIGTDTIWRWVAGPEGLEDGGNGRQFFTQNSTGGGGAAINGAYTNWSTTPEPNGAIPNGENALQFTGSKGLWNDLFASTVTLQRYLKETNLAASPLTISAGAGAVTFSSAVGSNKAVGALNITAGSIAINGGAVTTTDAQTYSNNVTLGSLATTLTQTATDTHFILQANQSITNAFNNDASLTIKTTGYIQLGSNSSISSSENKLNLILNADSDTDNGGSIWIPESASISTHGGNITLGGGSAPTSTAAKGFDATSDENNALHQGITLNGTVNASGGNINIRGEGLSTTNARGVSIGGDLSTSGTGTIDINGTGYGTSDGVAIGDAAITDPAGSINVGTGDTSINGIKEGTGNGISIASDSSITSAGDITLAANVGNLFANGAITANELQVFASISTVAVFDSTNNQVATLAANVSQDFSFVNSGALTIGHAGASDGIISDAGIINIATLTGDLTLAKSVFVGATLGGTDPLIVLNAGKNTAAGTATGGNILVTNEGDISTPTGRVILYSGSVSSSTGLTNFIGSASGKFRYNSDETTTNYTTALGDGNYAIYREQPTVTVTAVDDTKTYNKAAYASNNGVTYSGLVNGDTGAGLTGTLTYGGSSQSAVNVGNDYLITPAGLTGTGLGYAVNFASGTLTIDPKTLTISYASSDKTYDGSVTATVTGSLTGIIEGDTVTATQTAAFADKNVGTNKTVSVMGITLGGADAGNYNIASTAATTANITATTLTLSGFDAANKIYDGNTTATISSAGSLTGVIEGDAVDFSYGAATFDNKNVGTDKTVTLNDIALTGDDKTNYVLASTTTDTANITKKALAITASDKTQTASSTGYSGGNGVTYAGFITGEDESILGGTLIYSGTSQGAKTAGTYVITPAGLAADNYEISFNNGILTLTAATVSNPTPNPTPSPTPTVRPPLAPITAATTIQKGITGTGTNAGFIFNALPAITTIASNLTVNSEGGIYINVSSTPLSVGPGNGSELFEQMQRDHVEP